LGQQASVEPRIPRLAGRLGDEQIGVTGGASDETCRLCGGKLALLGLIIDSDTGTAFRMFGCKKCGDRIWFE
jgi:hypothetical protein